MHKHTLTRHSVSLTQRGYSVQVMVLACVGTEDGQAMPLLTSSGQLTMQHNTCTTYDRKALHLANKVLKINNTHAEDSILQQRIALHDNRIGMQ